MRTEIRLHGIVYKYKVKGQGYSLAAELVTMSFLSLLCQLLTRFFSDNLTPASVRCHTVVRVDHGTTQRYKHPIDAKWNIIVTRGVVHST